MAVQRCPKCGKKGMTWSIDEEITARTMWQCVLCGYQCEEDENEEKRCSKCGRMREMLLFDRKGSFRYCSQCSDLIR